MSNLGGLEIRKIFAFFLIIELAFGGSVFVFPSSANAATGVPQIVAYQGRLTDASGNLLGGSGTTYYFKFSIWDNATVGSGSRLWPTSAPTATTATVRSGVFNVNIGDTAAGYPDTLNYNFQDNADVYLQVEVSSDGLSYETLSPRQRITSAGFAVNAGSVLGYTPSQSPSGSNIPVLSNGNLWLAGANPQINATSSNALVLQGGATGDVMFFSSSSKISSSGVLTIPGVSFTNATGTGSLQVANLRVTASTTLGGIAYTWPSAGGSNGYVLSTDGNGVLSWVPDQTGSGVASYWTLAGATLFSTSTATSVGIGTSVPSTTLHVAGTFKANSTSTFGGTVAITGDLNASGTLTASGQSILNTVSSSQLTVSGNTNLGALQTSGALKASSTLEVTGNTQLTSLTASGQTTLSNASATNLYVSGATNLSSITASGQAAFVNVSSTNIYVAGTTNLATLVASGGTTLQSTLNVSGISTLTGITFTNATGTGNLQVATLNTTGAASIGGTLGVAGVASLAGLTFTNATGTGNLQTATLNTTGAASFGSSVGVAGALNASSTITSSGAVSFGSTLQVGGTATLSGTTNAVGALNASGTLTASGQTILNTVSSSQLTVNGNTNVNTLQSSGNISVGGTLGVTGQATLGNVSSTNLQVTGNANLGTTQASSLVVAGVSALQGVTFTNATGTGNLQVATFVTTGVATLASLTATGASTLANVSSTQLTVSGNTNLATLQTSGALKASSTLEVTGNTQLTSLTASGQTTLSNASTTGNFQVAGNTTLNNLTISGTLALPANSVGASELQSTSVAAGSYGSSTQAIVLTVDADGRLTSVATTSIVVATSQITGTLGVANGGTGATTFAANGVLYGNTTSAVQATAAGTSAQLLQANGSGVPTFVTLSGDATIASGGALTLANSGVVAGSYGSASIVPVITVDAKGRLTTVSTSSIAIDASQVMSGVLAVARGGTGTSTVGTAGGIVYSDGSVQQVSGAGSANQIVLSGGAGAPSFSNISGLLTAGSNIVISGTTNATVAVSSTPLFAGLMFTNATSTGNIQTATFVATGAASFAGAVNASGTLTASGQSIFNTVSSSQLTVNGNTNLNTLQTSGNASVGGTLNVAGNTQLANASTTNLHVIGSLRVTASTTFGGVTYTWPSTDGSTGQALTTNGSGVLSWSTANGAGGGGSTAWLQSGGVLYNTSTATQVGINTNAPSSSLHVIGTAIISGTTTISGPLKASSTLEVTGSTQLANASATEIYVTGNAILQSNLGVSGISSLAGLTFTNATGTGNLQVATLTTTGSASFGSTLTTSGKATLASASTTGDFGVGGYASLATTTVGTLTASGVVRASSTFEVSGTSLFGNSVTVGGRFQVDSTGNLVKINGVAYNWPSSQGGAGQILTNDGSGVLTWSAAGGGGGSSSWANLAGPTSSLSLAMASNTTTFTWNAATGANNLFTLTDTANNTGNGVLFNIVGNTGSSINPLRVSASGTTALAVSPTGLVSIGTSTANTALYVAGSFAVTGASTFSGALNASGTLTASGQSIFNTVSSSQLTVNGNTNLATLQTSGALKASSTLEVTGNTQLTSLTASGQTTLSNASATDIYVASRLVVVGSTTLGGVGYSWPGSAGSATQVLTTDGTGNLSWATASGGSVSTSSAITTNNFPFWSSTNGALSGTSTLTQSGGAITASGALNASSTFTASGAAILGSTLHVGGTTNLVGALTGTSASFSGALNASSTLAVSGATQLQSTLQVLNNSSLQNVSTTNLYANGTFQATGRAITLGSAGVGSTILRLKGDSSINSGIELVAHETAGNDSVAMISVNDYPLFWTGVAANGVSTGDSVDFNVSTGAKIGFDGTGYTALNYDMYAGPVYNTYMVKTLAGGGNLSTYFDGSETLRLGTGYNIATSTLIGSDITLVPSSTLHVVGSFTATGASTLANVSSTQLTVSGNTNLGALQTSGALKASSTLEVTGNTQLTSLTASGNASLQNVSSTNSYVSGTLNVIGTSYLNNVSTTNLYASTNISGASLNISGGSALAGVTFTNATGTGNLQVATLTTTGKATLASASTTGDFGVSGYTALATTTAGTLSATSLTVSGASSLQNTSTTNAYVAGILAVTGTSYLQNVSSTNLYATGNANVGSFQSSGTAQFGSTVNISGTTTAAGINASGALNASSTLAVSGATQLQSTLQVLGNSSLTNVSSTNITASGYVNLSRLIVGSDSLTDITGSGLAISGNALAVSGLTTSNFASANVSQWTNDAGYLTAAITSLNGQTGATQTFATTTASNIFTLTSTGNTHTLTLPSNVGFFSNDAGYLTSSPISTSSAITTNNFPFWSSTSGALSGTSTLTQSGGAITASGALNASSTFTASGAATLGSTLQVGGTATLSGTTNAVGAINASSTFTASGATILGSTLHVGGTTNLVGALTGTSASFSGALRASSTLEVTGATQLANASTTNLYVAARLTVVGSTTLNGVGYTWPSSAGSTGQILSTDGTGTLTWTSQVSDDTRWILSGATMYATSTATKVGIGTIAPSSTLHVVGDFTVTATSTFQGQTTIDDLVLGATSFDTDSGMVTWMDMLVTSGAASGTVESYTARIDGNNLMTIYSESDGAGGIQNKRIGVLTTVPSSTLHVVGTMTVTGASTLANVSSTQLTVSGVTNLATTSVATLNASGTLTASGQSILNTVSSSQLTVSGNTNLGALQTSGALKASSTLEVTGNTQFANVSSTNFYASGNANIATAQIVGAFRASSTLDVTGAVIAGSTLQVGGAITGGGTVTGAGNFSAGTLAGGGGGTRYFGATDRGGVEYKFGIGHNGADDSLAYVGKGTTPLVQWDIGGYMNVGPSINLQIATAQTLGFDATAPTTLTGVAANGDTTISKSAASGGSWSFKYDGIETMRIGTGLSIATSTIIGDVIGGVASSTLHVVGTMTVTGASTLANVSSTQLTVSGNTNLATLQTSGALKASSTLEVTGNTQLANASATNLYVAGRVNIAEAIGASATTFQISNTNSATSSFKITNGYPAGGGYLPTVQGTSYGIPGFGLALTGQIPAEQDSDNGFSLVDAAVSIVGQRSDTTKIQAANILSINNGSTTNLFVVDKDGKVGIGAPVPSSTLHVVGSFRASASSTFDTLTASSLIMADASKSLAPVTIGSGLSLSGNVLSVAGAAGTVSTSTIVTVGYVPTWGTTSALAGTSTIFQSGSSIGIGTIAPSSTLHVIGTLTVTGASTLANVSSTQLTVSGNTNLGALQTSGALKASSTLEVTGNTQLANASATSLYASGNIYASGNLSQLTSSGGSGRLVLSDGSNNPYLGVTSGGNLTTGDNFYIPVSKSLNFGNGATWDRIQNLNGTFVITNSGPATMFAIGGTDAGVPATSLLSIDNTSTYSAYTAGDTGWTKSQASGGVAKFLFDNTARIGVDSTGLAIGTDNSVLAPSSTLHVVGTFQTTGTNTFSGALNASSTLAVSGAAQLQSSLFVVGAIRASSTLEVSGATQLGGAATIGGVFQTNATTTLAIGGQNVGVGTTVPSSTLHVVGTFQVTGTSTFSGPTSISDLSLGAARFEADAGILSWVDLPVTASSSAGTINSYSAQIDGNALLTITSEADGSGGIRNAGVSVGTSTLVGLFNVGSSTSNYFTVASSSGYVGIGTTSPSTTLTVVGTFFNSGTSTFFGPAYFQNTLTASGRSILGTASSTQLTVSGNTNLTTLQTSGALNASSTFTASGAAILGSTLHVGGTTNLVGALTGTSASFSGALNASSTLAVSGATQLQSTLQVLNNSSLQNVSTTNLYANGTFQATGRAITLGSTGVGSTILRLKGDSSINSGIELVAHETAGNDSVAMISVNDYPLFWTGVAANGVSTGDSVDFNVSTGAKIGFDGTGYTALNYDMYAGPVYNTYMVKTLAGGGNLSTYFDGSETLRLGTGYNIATSTLIGSDITLVPSSTLHVVGTFRSTATSTLATAGGMVGVGTTAPSSTLHVVGSFQVTATSTFSGGQTIIDDLVLGTTGFEQDAGQVSWTDMSVTASSSVNTAMSYSAQLDGNPMITVYGKSNGAGGVYDLGVGIGTSTPAYTLHVFATSTTVAAFERGSDDGTLISLRQGGSEEGTISVSGTTISYNAFTGSHYGLPDDASEVFKKGEVIVLTGNNGYLHNRSDSEILYGITKSKQANDPAVLGAYLAIQEPNAISSTSNPTLVMAVGNGDVWIVDNGQDVAVGDYLITSDVLGHAMKDPRTAETSFVFARASEPIHWADVTETIDGKKHKRVAVFFESFARDNAAAVADVLQSSGNPTGISADAHITVASLTVNGSVVIKGTTTFNKDTAGRAKILQGAQEVRVEFSEEYQNEPIVNVTPFGQAALDINFRYSVINLDKTGFTIKINNPAYEELAFNWTAFASAADAKLFVSDGTQGLVNVVVIEPAVQSPIIVDVATSTDSIANESQGDESEVEVSGEDDVPAVVQAEDEPASESIEGQVIGSASAIEAMSPSEETSSATSSEVAPESIPSIDTSGSDSSVPTDATGEAVTPEEDGTNSDTAVVNEGAEGGTSSTPPATSNASGTPESGS